MNKINLMVHYALWGTSIFIVDIAIKSL